MRDLSSLTSTDFDAVVGSDFQVGDDGTAPVGIRLREVLVGPEQPGRRRPFSLRFSGPAAPVLDSVSHRLHHAQMGELEIFLVPIAAEPEGLVYEAVFT